MKCQSAADAKHYNHGRLKTDLPNEGTRVREVYDLFQNNKGSILNTTLNELGCDYTTISQLVDFYGLDIRRLGHRKWCLVGEWFGKTYIDYLAESIKPKRKQ
jgi:hypothetical protein